MSWESLASGVIGALLGAGITVALYLIDRRYRESNAIRAVVSEIAINAHNVELLESGLMIAGPASSALFEAHVSSIAARLSPDEFGDLVSAYSLVPWLARLHAAAVIEGKDVTELEGQGIKKAKELFDKAGKILAAKVA